MIDATFVKVDQRLAKVENYLHMIIDLIAYVIKLAITLIIVTINTSLVIMRKIKSIVKYEYSKYKLIKELKRWHKKEVQLRRNAEKTEKKTLKEADKQVSKQNMFILNPHFRKIKETIFINK